MTGDVLEPRVRELFSSLAHAGELRSDAPDAVWRGEAGREALGTRVRFELEVSGGVLQAVRYRAYGCPYTLATCEWLARRLEGRRAEAPGLGTPLDWARELQLPAARLGRLLVIEDALRAALIRA